MTSPLTLLLLMMTMMMTQCYGASEADFGAQSKPDYVGIVADEVIIYIFCVAAVFFSLSCLLSTVIGESNITR